MICMRDQKDNNLHNGRQRKTKPELERSWDLRSQVYLTNLNVLKCKIFPLYPKLCDETFS